MEKIREGAKQNFLDGEAAQVKAWREERSREHEQSMAGISSGQMGPRIETRS